MKHTFLAKLLLGTALISSAYTPTLYGMIEEEKTSIEETKTVVVKKQNLFGIKGPLQSWQPINHTGDFDTAPKNLQSNNKKITLTEATTAYIDQVANGKLDVSKETGKWSQYFSKEDFDKAHIAFKDKKKLTGYLNEYLKHDFTTFDKNRDTLDTFFFTKKYHPFLNILKPLFETIAFYKKDDVRFNCVGMHYLGWINQIEGKNEEATHWYSMAALLGRIAEFQLPMYLKIYDKSKEHKALMFALQSGMIEKKAKEKTEKFFLALKENNNLLFYKKSLERLEKWEAGVNKSAVEFCNYIDTKSSVIDKHFPFFQDAELKNSFHIPSLKGYLCWSLESTSHAIDPLVDDTNGPPPFLQSKIVYYLLAQNLNVASALEGREKTQEIVSDYRKKCIMQIIPPIVTILSDLNQWDNALSFSRTSDNLESKMIWISQAIHNFLHSGDSQNNDAIAILMQDIDKAFAKMTPLQHLKDENIYHCYRYMSEFPLPAASDKIKGFEQTINLTERALLFANSEEERK